MGRERSRIPMQDSWPGIGWLLEASARSVEYSTRRARPWGLALGAWLAWKLDGRADGGRADTGAGRGSMWLIRPGRSALGGGFPNGVKRHAWRLDKPLPTGRALSRRRRPPARPPPRDSRAAWRHVRAGGIGRRVGLGQGPHSAAAAPCLPAARIEIEAGRRARPRVRHMQFT